MPRKRVERDFQFVSTHLFTRRKSVMGYLYTLADEQEVGGVVLVYADYNKHAHGCTCLERDPRYICAHIKFIERVRGTFPRIRNPMGTEYVEGSAVSIDESLVVESPISLQQNQKKLVASE